MATSVRFDVAVNWYIAELETGVPFSVQFTNVYGAVGVAVTVTELFAATVPPPLTVPPLDGFAETLMTYVGAAASTVRLNVFVADVPSLLDTFTVNVYVPGVVGVPDTRRLAVFPPAIVSPGGALPSVTVHVFSPDPPVAVIDAE